MHTLLCTIHSIVHVNVLKFLFTILESWFNTRARSPTSDVVYFVTMVTVQVYWTSIFKHYVDLLVGTR